MALHCPDSLTTMANFFNGLAPGKLENLGDVYSPGIEFLNPIRHTRGLAELRGVYEDVFRQFDNVTVTVIDAHGDDRTGFLLWTMRYHFRSKERMITGASHLKFAPDGRVAVQRDYWDASSPVYGEYPLIGLAIRGIKRLMKPVKQSP